MSLWWNFLMFYIQIFLFNEGPNFNPFSCSIFPYFQSLSEWDPKNGSLTFINGKRVRSGKWGTSSMHCAQKYASHVQGRISSVCRELGVKRKRLCHIRFRLDGYNFFFRRRPINVSVARITQPSAEHEREPAVAAVPTLFAKLFPGFSLAFPLFFPLSLYTFTFVISVRLACKLLSDSCTCPPARRA